MAKKVNLSRNFPLHVMLLPAVIVVIIYSYMPIFLGFLMAFQRFIPAKTIFMSKFVGFDNFNYIFSTPEFDRVLFNTIYISVLKIIVGLFTPVIFALLLNEVKSIIFKRTVQTLVYLPYFISWVILGGMFVDILSSEGIVNNLMGVIGIEPVFFLGKANIFPYVLVATHTWQQFGFGTIIYLAALTSIDPCLYEASIIDGADRWRQTIYITLPGIMPIVILMTVLSLGNVLNAGFDQVFNLYNPAVYKTGDIIDTFVYRLGLVDMQYSPATAVGLFKSVISFVLVTISYRLADRYAGYRVF